MKTLFKIAPLLVIPLIGYAQSPLETANEALDPDSQLAFPETEGGLKEVPALSDEENADLGPQYLLVPGTPAHNWFLALADFQWLRSSNPTLDDSAISEASDLAVATAQFGIETPAKAFLGGSISANGGIRYQIFRYGTIDEATIAGVPVDRNDFEGTTFFSKANWSKENWMVGLGLRWTQLDNNAQGSGFFEEFVPSWEVSRDFYTGPNTRVRLRYDGAYFATDSKALVAPFNDLNDRLSNSLSVSLLHRINRKLFIEPSIRYTFADYQGDLYNDREDKTLRLGASLSYFPQENLQLRLFSGYQKRNSNELGIVDYENWDLGLGTTLSMRF